MTRGEQREELQTFIKNGSKITSKMRKCRHIGRGQNVWAEGRTCRCVSRGQKCGQRGQDA